MEISFSRLWQLIFLLLIHVFIIEEVRNQNGVFLAFGQTFIVVDIFFNLNRNLNRTDWNLCLLVVPKRSEHFILILDSSGSQDILFGERGNRNHFQGRKIVFALRNHRRNNSRLIILLGKILDFFLGGRIIILLVFICMKKRKLLKEEFLIKFAHLGKIKTASHARQSIRLIREVFLFIHLVFFISGESSGFIDNILTEFAKIFFFFLQSILYSLLAESFFFKFTLTDSSKNILIELDFLPFLSFKELDFLIIFLTIELFDIEFLCVIFFFFFVEWTIDILADLTIKISLIGLIHTHELDRSLEKRTIDKSLVITREFNGRFVMSRLFRDIQRLVFSLERKIIG